jgi:hypothetical protein
MAHGFACVARGDGGSGAVEGRVEGSEAHGKLETEERGFEERSEEVRDDGGSGTVEERVEESEEAECGPSSSSLRSSEEAPAATKRRRLSEITAMGYTRAYCDYTIGSLQPQRNPRVVDAWSEYNYGFLYSWLGSLSK